MHQSIDDLVSAQVEVNRAVFEMNRPGEVPPLQREPELRYVMRSVCFALEHLATAKAALARRGVKPFSDREMKKWERSLSHKLSNWERRR